MVRSIEYEFILKFENGQRYVLTGEVTGDWTNDPGDYLKSKVDEAIKVWKGVNNEHSLSPKEDK